MLTGCTAVPSLATSARSCCKRDAWGGLARACAGEGRAVHVTFADALLLSSMLWAQHLAALPGVCTRAGESGAQLGA